MKADDDIFLAVDNRLSRCKVEQITDKYTLIIRADGLYIVSPVKHFLFYYYGYRNKVRFLFIRKWWHYPFAAVCENLRRLLTNNSKMIHYD